LELKLQNVWSAIQKLKEASFGKRSYGIAAFKDSLTNT